MVSKLFDGCGITRRDRDKYSDWSGMAGLSQVNNLRMHEARACCADGVPRVTSSFLGSSPIRRQNFVSAI